MRKGEEKGKGEKERRERHHLEVNFKAGQGEIHDGLELPLFGGLINLGVPHRNGGLFQVEFHHELLIVLGQFDLLHHRGIIKFNGFVELFLFLIRKGEIVLVLVLVPTELGEIEQGICEHSHPKKKRGKG